MFSKEEIEARIAILEREHATAVGLEERFAQAKLRTEGGINLLRAMLEEKSKTAKQMEPPTPVSTGPEESKK